MLSTESKMARGAAWMLLFKWVERGLGLVSTLILVRVLSPSDFGIVAMAMSFIAMAELLTGFAFDIALIHDDNAGPAHYNSAWTANIVLGLVIAGLMFVLASPIATFYDEPGLNILIYVLALGPIVSGLENIGIVAFRKELDFRREFVFQVSRKIIGFCIAIPLAFQLRSYWALVFGIIGSKCGGTVLSYWVHSFRPRISFEQIGALLRFSRWLLLNNVVNFFKDRSTDFFLGRMQGPASLGLYNVTQDFANLPTFEVGAPINRALLPGFSKLKGQKEGLQAAFANATGLVAIIAIPIGAGLYAIAPIMVPVLLGQQWLEAIPIMEVLALNSAVLVFHGTMVTLFISTGRPQTATVTNLIFVVLMLAGFPYLISSFGALGAAYSVFGACMFVTPIFLYQLRRFLSIEIKEFVKAVYRPVLASATMAGLVRALIENWRVMEGIAGGVLQLVAMVFVGAASYAVALVLLWLLSGRGPGAEQLVVEKVAQRIIHVRRSLGKSEIRQ